MPPKPSSIRTSSSSRNIAPQIRSHVRFGWTYALAIWGYALAWLFINDLVKVAVYKLLQTGGARVSRHHEGIAEPLGPVAKPRRAAGVHA